MKTSGSKYRHCLYFTANALARKIEKISATIWAGVDLSPSHAYLLMAVLDEPGMQPGLLAQHLQLQPSTITRLVEKLEEKKLLVRTTEGKLTNIYPTPKAKELYPKLKDCVMRFKQQYEEILGAEESGRMVDQMARMADQLDD
jgi:MarR family transcriptional regulator, organic hydroperoxide resistance regulator